MIERLGLDIVPYIVLLIVPVLGRTTDQHVDVRTLATQCFAALIRLLPLEVGLHLGLNVFTDQGACRSYLVGIYLNFKIFYVFLCFLLLLMAQLVRVEVCKP